MEYLNYVICFALIVLAIIEVLFIIKRNRTIKFRGKDDLFTFTIIIFFAILFFPFDIQNSIVESLRNTMMFVVIFGSVGVRRGFSDKGLEKFLYTVPFDKILGATIDEHQLSKAVLTIKTEKKSHKLYFNKYTIKPVIRLLQEKNIEVLIDQKIEKLIMIKK